MSKESERHLPNLALLKPPDLREQGVICVIPFTFECISAISTIRLKVPQELKSKEARDALAITLAVRDFILNCFPFFRFFLNFLFIFNIFQRNVSKGKRANRFGLVI